MSLGISLVQAQGENMQTILKTFPKERVEISTNSEIFLSGQMLGYKINSFTNGISGVISDVAYVELVSDTKSTVFKHKLRLNNGKAFGDYFLPTTLKTGHYKLIAYTAWTLNNAEGAFYQTDIYVINPYLNASENNLKNEFGENEGYIEISINPEISYKKNSQADGLKLFTDSGSYKKRSKVKLSLQNTSNATSYGTYSVLVKKIDSIEAQKHHINKGPNTKEKTSAYLPEMRGELIQGTVVDIKTNVPATNQAVSLSIGGDDHVYKSTQTNAKGQFYFNLFETYEVDKAVIQVVAENRNDYKLIIEPKTFDRYNELEFYPIKLNKNLESYITQNSVYNQVESAYYNLKRDSLMVKSPAKSFYGAPDTVYVLDDFTRFNSVKETFIEVVQEAAIRTTNGNFQFLVYDFNDPFGSIFAGIKPLLLLEGIQIQDETIVVDYNPQEIESVSLVRGIYSFGSVTYNGIIDIKLKRPTEINLSGSFLQNLEIEKPVVQKEYFKQSYIEEQKRTPDFRTQLLWHPDFDLKSNSKTIEFYTSDVSGYYMIELNGITTDGKSIQLDEIFEVINE